MAQQWPGWYFDAQSASEYAQRLSSQLGASVSAQITAGTWLAQHPKPPPAHAHHHRHRPGPAGQQQQQRKRPAPRQHLNNTGVTAAIRAVLAALLAELWAAAAAMGWAAAVTVLGVGALAGADQALADLLRAGKGRLPSIVQTRLSRIERALIQALRDGTSVDALAAEISAILGSDVSALLVTSTETTWASQQAALAAYQAAGVKEVIWQTRNDDRVCFPAGTPVATPRGDVPIESLKPGDFVLTPQGRRAVRATCSRAYTGRATVIQAEGATVAATDDHPFWTAVGWREAGQLKPGDLLQTLDNEFAEITRVVHLRFGEANGAEVPWPAPPPSTHEDFAAVIARVTEGHGGSLAEVGVVPGHLIVYDIEVEREHVFYANRFLVHNCGRCLANQAAGPKPIGTVFPSGDKAPPIHPRCRCSLLPAPPPKQGAKR